MIIGWEKGDDCWTSIGSPDIVREQMFEGNLETRGHGSSGLSGCKKNGLWQLWQETSEPLRQEGTADTGSVVRRCADLPGGGGSAGLLSGVRKGEAGEVGLACQQSLLYEAVYLLCGAEVSSDDGTGCCEGAALGLAYGKGFGEGVYGGATSSYSCRCSWGDWDRRGIAAQGTYLSDYRERSGAGASDLVRREGSI